MLNLSIPGFGDFALQHIVFDVNGTLATDGELVAGVAERLSALGEMFAVHMLTADTHGKQAAIDAQLGLTASRVAPVQEREQKTAFVDDLGAAHVIAIGNGGNDAGMLQAAALGIAVIGEEGLSVEALLAADVVTHHINDALDLLLKPKRLAATLRR